MSNIVSKLLTIMATGLIAVGGMTSAFATADNTQVLEPDETEISVTAEVESVPQCNWYFTGVGDADDTLLLENPTGELYRGDDLPIEASDDAMSVYLSGSLIENTNCSYYGDERGVNVQVSWSGTGFTDVDNDSLDWNLSVSNPLSIDLAHAETCSDDWTFTTAILSGAYSAPPKEPLTISNLNASTYNPTGYGIPTKVFPSCDFSAKYSTNVPAGLVPAGSNTFNLQGPIVTMLLVMNP